MPEISGDDDLEAWCNQCDKELEAEGWEWNDRSESNLGLTAVCSECFARYRVKNEAATRKVTSR